MIVKNVNQHLLDWFAGLYVLLFFSQNRFLLKWLWKKTLLSPKISYFFQQGCQASIIYAAMMNCNLKAICPSLFEHIQEPKPGRGTFHLISFLPNKQATWSTQGSNSQDKKNALQACFIKLIFLLIQHCHHCDHSKDFLWSCIAITSLRSFFWSCPAIVVIILKISFDLALPSLPSLWSLRSVVQWRLLSVWVWGRLRAI